MASNPSVAPNQRGGQCRQTLLKKLQLYGYSVNREAMLLLEDHYKSFEAKNRYESIEDFIHQLNRVILFQTFEGTSVIGPSLAFTAIQELSNQHKQRVNERPTEGSEKRKEGNVGNQLDALRADSNAEESEQQVLPPSHSLTVRLKNVECNLERQQQAIGTSAGRLNNSLEETDFNAHYKFLLKRLTSLPIFKDQFTITSLATLTGSRQSSIRCICFGLLVKDITKIDTYTLIDDTGRVPVKITPDTSFRNRLAYSNCLVLVEGVYVNPDDLLFAANIGLPPVLLDPVQEKHLACEEEKMIVILKEIYLDDEDVVQSADLLFSGYNSLTEPPLVFILIGDFTRHPCLPSVLRSHMKKLIRSIRSCDNLKNSHFVFVPGLRDSVQAINGDIVTSKSMPKAPLSKEQLPVDLMNMSGYVNVHLATNPAHIYVGDRQITVVCHSYFKELKNYLLHDMSDRNEELFETSKQIILSNAHLAGGISKTYQNSLSLWHKPDLLVLADSESFGRKYDYNLCKSDDVSFMTLPSFARQSGQFKVYYLRSGDIDESEVSPEALDHIETVDLDEDEDESNNSDQVESRDHFVSSEKV